MITWNLLAFFLVHTSLSKPDTRAFPIADFNDKLKTAEWMVAYDSAAWRMSELVTHVDNDLLARMGREWFCYRGADSLWNGVYGKYKDGKYDLVIQYRIEASDSIKIVEVEEKPDSTMLIAVSKAINTAYTEAGQRLGKSYVRFNKFIRYQHDHISIWLLPALQPNEIALYGGEFYYRFDNAGEKILERWEYFQGFKGFRFGKGREVKLEYEAAAAPTLGAVYFALQYRDQFKDVKIETRESISVLSFNQVKGYYWEHKEKDLRKIVN